jgi:tRNA dimethylallyltransferase
MQEKIVTNTARLAKRQRTFNSSQFTDKRSLPLKELREELMEMGLMEINKKT